MKHIVYIITQSHFGGAQKYVHDLALHIAQIDEYKISVAVGEGETEAWMTELKEAGIPVIRLTHVKRNLSPWHDLLSGFELFSLYRKTRPDVIHLNSSKVGATGAVAGWLYKLLTPKTRNVKIVYTVHGLILEEPLSKWQQWYYWFAEWFGAKFKDRLISVSYHSKESLLKYNITSPEKISVVHNAININELQFLPREQARTALSELSTFQITNQDIIIGTIAGLYETKGLPYLIKAAGLVIDNLPNNFDKAKIKFVIIGTGPQKQALEQRIKDEKLMMNMLLAGQIVNAPELLKAFDVFALPSVKEGLSYTLIEARAAGLPIVATRVGGNPEVIEDQITGLLVPSKDPDTLSAALLSILKNNHLRETLAEKTREGLDHFSIQTLVSETLKAYE